jgi:hypothetical protein
VFLLLSFSFVSCSGDFVGVRIFVGWRQTKLLQHRGCVMILILYFSTQRSAWCFSYMFWMSAASSCCLAFFFFGKKKFIECFINAWINFLICSSYFHYGKGALLDGYKRNCPSQYWWSHNPCQHWYWCNNCWGTSLWLVSSYVFDIIDLCFASVYFSYMCFVLFVIILGLKLSCVISFTFMFHWSRVMHGSVQILFRICKFC